MVDDYSELTNILTELRSRSHYKDIFVSGSAHEYGPLGRDRIEAMTYLLGQEIIKRGYNPISGLGLGIGSVVMSGSLEELYLKKHAKVND